MKRVQLHHIVTLWVVGGGDDYTVGWRDLHPVTNQTLGVQMNKEQTIEDQINYLNDFLKYQVAKQKDLEYVSFPYEHCYYKTDSTEDGSVKDVLSVDDFTWEPAYYIGHLRQEKHFSIPVVTKKEVEDVSSSCCYVNDLTDYLEKMIYDGEAFDMSGDGVLYDHYEGFRPTLNEQGKSNVRDYLDQNFTKSA